MSINKNSSSPGSNIESVRSEAISLSTRIFRNSVLGIALSMPLNIISALALGPVGYGVIRIVELIMKYSSYADLGAKFAISRQVPILLGEEKKEEALLVSGLVLTWMLIVSVMVMLFFGLFYYIGIDIEGILTYQNSLIVVSLIVINRFNTFLNSFLQAHGIFEGVSAKYFISKVISPWIRVGAILLWGVTGALSAMLISAIVLGSTFIFFVYNKMGGFNFRISMQFNLLFNLLKKNILLYFSSFVEMAYKTIDLAMLTYFATVNQVGLMGFAHSFLNLSAGVSGGLNVVTKREMLLERGKRGSDFKDYVFIDYMGKTLAIYMLINSLTLGISYHVYEIGVELFLPEFLGSLPIARIIILAQMIYVLVHSPLDYLIATDRIKERLWIGISALIVAVIANYMFLSFGYGAIGVAWGFVISAIAYSMIVMVRVTSYKGGAPKSGAVFGIKVVFISFILAAFIRLLSLWSVSPVVATTNELFQSILSVGFSGIKTLIQIGITVFIYSIVFREYSLHKEILILLKNGYKSIAGRIKSKSDA